MSCRTAVDYVKAIAAAGVDAVIVQDLGLVRLAAPARPDLHVHGSTQMTLTEPRGIEFVQAELGVERVVLARELSTDDIADHRRQRPTCRWKSSSTAHCASPTPANA